MVEIPKTPECNSVDDIGRGGGKLAVMAKEKRPVGRPKGEPTTTIHTSIRVSVGRALRAYIASKPDGAQINRIIERALIAVLVEEGFWPPPESDKPKREHK